MQYVHERAENLIVILSARVENVRERAAMFSDRPRCFLMEWIDPPFCSGHRGPKLVDIADGHDSLGRAAAVGADRMAARCWRRVLRSLCLRFADTPLIERGANFELLRRFPGFDSISAADNGQVYVVMPAHTSAPGSLHSGRSEFLAKSCTRANFPSSFRAGPTIRA